MEYVPTILTALSRQSICKYEIGPGLGLVGSGKTALHLDDSAQSSFCWKEDEVQTKDAKHAIGVAYQNATDDPSGMGNIVGELYTLGGACDKLYPGQGSPARCCQSFEHGTADQVVINEGYWCRFYA
jgi:hypothetical protein